MRINERTLYVERLKSNTGKINIKSKDNTAYRKNQYRDWFLVKYGNNNSNIGVIYLGSLCIPAKYIGKKVRLKLEEVEERRIIK